MGALNKIIFSFLKNPWQFAKRIVFKAIIGPLKYRKNNDYNAYRYWRDRLSKGGLKFNSSSDETISEKDSFQSRGIATKTLLKICSQKGINFQKATILDVGCGNGYYTGVFRNLNVKKYFGVDITDVLFPQLRKKFPEYKFIKKDISTEEISGKYDLVILISVIHHIITEEKLSFCLKNLINHLNRNGVLVISRIMKKNQIRLLPFYIRAWSPDDVKNRLKNCKIETTPFQDDLLLIIQNQI